MRRRTAPTDAKLTLTVRQDPSLGHYGRGTWGGQTVVSTGYHKTEAEAWVALRQAVDARKGR